MHNELITYLESFITEERKNLFHRIIEQRTRYLTVVLEDIFQPQNASAVLRTCDCFGIQDVHIIENSNKYTLNPDVTLGSDKWLNLTKYNKNENNTLAAIADIKNKGYRIVATVPYGNSVELDQFDLKKGKTALLFGTEMRGLTSDALSQADEFVKIPMVGFTESFNISVSAAIILYQLSTTMRRCKNIDWQLTDDQKQDILLQWLNKTIRNPEPIIRNYYKQLADK